MANFTFKKQKAETGLAAIASPRPNTDIKLDKRRVGLIYAPSRFGVSRDQWRVGLTVKKEPTEDDTCQFQWIFFKARFDEEKDAREWLKTNQEYILNKYDLYQFED